MDQRANPEKDDRFINVYRWQNVLFPLFFALISILFFAYSAGNPMRGTHSFWEYRRKAACRHTEIIAAAMSRYALEHGGLFPTGTSSTEVFQKLIDGHYVSDPSVFFVYGALNSDFNNQSAAPARSSILRPENVRFDVTAPLTMQSPDGLPIVFLTGCKISYKPGASAQSNSSNPLCGLSVVYKGMIPNPNWLTYLYGEPQTKIQRFTPADYDGGPHYITNFISPDFKADSTKYVQLTPDGPLAP